MHLPNLQPNEDPDDQLIPQGVEPEFHPELDPDELQIPPLPPSATFDSFNELYAFLQTFHRENGAAIVKRNSWGKRIVNGQAQVMNYILICDRGRSRASKSVGLRNASTQKIDCPVKITASMKESSNWKWTYRIDGCHNHGQSLDPSAHNIHRRRTLPQQELERNISKHRALPAREMASIIRDSTAVAGVEAFFRQRDIYNDRQKIRAAALGVKTATQAFIDHLQRGGLKHIVKYDEDDEHKVEAIFWTYPWCETMWKRFPEVLGLDNTYKTNRFKMYLFQATGVTDQRSVANFAFGLINTEKEEGFHWLSERLNELRQQVGAPEPTVIITDKEKALKNALLRVFPSSQQQLCVWHVNAKIRARIKSRWKELGAADYDDDDEADEGEADDTVDPNDHLFGRNATQEEAEVGISGLPNHNPEEYSRDTMFTAWRTVIYAPTEEKFYANWKAFDRTYEQQRHILRYISKEYMPWREQWACCYISRYRNFGQRVNSPVETAHKDVKSYLLTGTGDLLHLHNALLQMIANKERTYKQEAGRQKDRLRLVYKDQKWLGELNVQVTYIAVNLLAEQHRLALAAMPSQGKGPVPLQPCQQRFTQQCGLPCAHVIFQRLQADIPLTKLDVHPRWWLIKPLVRALPLF